MAQEGSSFGPLHCLSNVSYLSGKDRKAAVRHLVVSATSEQSAGRVSTGTDIPGKNRFSSGILLLKTVNYVLCRATD